VKNTWVARKCWKHCVVCKWCFIPACTTIYMYCDIFATFKS